MYDEDQRTTTHGTAGYECHVCAVSSHLLLILPSLVREDLLLPGDEIEVLGGIDLAAVGLRKASKPTLVELARTSMPRISAAVATSISLSTILEASEPCCLGAGTTLRLQLD
eukprot:SAG11_NODE_7503_length_1136_cov_1.815815_1_plen_111_part_10